MGRGKMRNWNSIVAVWWVIVAVIGSGSEHHNEKEFKHLCKILRVAEGKPEKIPDELGKFTEATHALDSLIRATRTSTATYQKVVKLSAADKEDADFISYTVKRKTANAKIQHAMEKVEDIYNRMGEELIQAKKERTLAQNNLVHAIYGVQVGELPKDEEISEVLQNVSQSSISNDNGGERKVKYHDAKMENPCGGKGESGAGFTLINDFYCLCVGKDNEKKVCHEKIKGPGKWELEECKDCKDCCKDGNCCCCCKNCNECKCEKNCNCDNCNCGSDCCKDGKCQKCVLKGTWLKMKNETGGDLDLQHGWPHIRNVCLNTSTETVNTTAESIQEVLDEFNKLLGGNSKKEIEPKSADMDARRLFILGRAKKMDDGCNGNGDKDAICVNYWAVSNLGIGIVWQNYMLEAQKQLQAMDKHIQKAQQLSRMIQKLKESAEESYRNSAHEGMLWPLQDGSRKNTSHNFLIFFACLF